MKNEVRTRSFNSKLDRLNSNQGFSFIESLVFLLILGILTAITLPSFLQEGCKAKQSEPKLYIRSINKAQQAYFLEKRVFTNSIEPLGIGIKNQTVSYNYSTRATKNAAFTYAISRSEVKSIKSYVGGIFVVPATQVEPKAAKDEITTISILCEANSTNQTKSAEPKLQNGKPTCGDGNVEVIK